MSSNGGTTAPGTPGRHRGRRALAWAAVLVVGLAGLVGALVGLTTAPSTAAGASSMGATSAPRRTAGATTVLDAAAPPRVPVPVAPGTEVPAGLDQSDPFLTVAGGRYELLTSGGTGDDPMNVPLTTSTDFAHWTTPVDALPVLPAWAQPGFTWAPDLHRFGSTYALYFTAMVADRAPQTECVGSAFSSSPTGPFTASPVPFICQLDQGGTIDPRVFVDHDGTPWMLFKSDQNIGGASTPTVMWSQQLSADGTTLLGSPSALLSPDRPWQGTIVEAPDMVEVGGAFWVFYSGNWYNQPDYAVGAARCAGPAGPCADTAPAPCSPPTSRGRGRGRPRCSRTPKGSGCSTAPGGRWPRNPTCRRGRCSSPGSASAPTAPTWPRGRCRGRPTS